MTEAAYPHDVDPAIWTRDGVNRFVRADGAAIAGIGRGQWCATVQRADFGTTFVGTRRGSARKFPSAGAAARFLVSYSPLKGTSNG